MSSNRQKTPLNRWSDFVLEDDTFKVIPKTPQPEGKTVKSPSFEIKMKQKDGSYSAFSMSTPKLTFRYIEAISPQTKAPYEIIFASLDLENEEHMLFKKIMDDVRFGMMRAIMNCKPVYMAIGGSYASLKRDADAGNYESLSEKFQKFIVPRREDKDDPESKITGYSLSLAPSCYVKEVEGNKVKERTCEFYTFEWNNGKKTPVAENYEHFLGNKELGDKGRPNYKPEKRAPSFYGNAKIFGGTGTTEPSLTPRLGFKAFFIEEIHELSTSSGISKDAIEFADEIKISDDSVAKNKRIINSLKTGVFTNVEEPYSPPTIDHNDICCADEEENLDNYN